MAQSRFNASGANDTTTLRRATSSAFLDLVKQLNAELNAERAAREALEARIAALEP